MGIEKETNMSATVKLPYVRFVRQVSSGGSLSKYGYVGIMQTNAAALRAAPWVKAGSDPADITLTTNKVTKTDGVFDAETGTWTTAPTYTAYISDIYDCFNQAGDGVAANATMCGYAGCVAYRFKLPTSESANPLQSVYLGIQRDRYLRAGVRISLQLSDSETPSDDWSVIRGEATGCVRTESTAPTAGVVGVESFGFLGQQDVPYVTASRAMEGTATFDTASVFADAASHAYLWCYLTLEDPTGYWNLYNATTARQYYIEGSAMLVADGCAFTFESDVTVPSEDTPTFDIIRGGICSSKAETDVIGVVARLDNWGNPYAGDDDLLTSAKDYAYSFRNCFAKFYLGEVESIAVINQQSRPDPSSSTSATYNTVRCGASFVFRQSAYGSMIAASSFMLPTSVPCKWKANAIKLDWADNWVGSATEGGRFNVWIKRDSYLTQYPEATLKNPRIYDASADTVDGFELVGVIDATASARTATLPLKNPLDGYVATILLTAFWSMDDINPSEISSWGRLSSSSTFGAGYESYQGANGFYKGETWLPDMSFARI